jgi:hypothetical protein
MVQCGLYTPSLGVEQANGAKGRALSGARCRIVRIFPRQRDIRERHILCEP